MAALALIAVPGAAPVRILDSDLEYYPVTGGTEQEIRASLDRGGPSDHEGNRYSAYTSWSIPFSFSTVRQPGPCKLQLRGPEVKASTRMPLWSPSRSADAALVKRWSGFVADLAAHEQGHVSIAREAGAAFRRAFAEMEPGEDCEVFVDEVLALRSDLTGRFHAVELRYDAETDHGATQGARFP
ncbi:MAG: DUF922 domain-containing protein [Deltaproteobacteria bacterium]|nr:DUF922 domain-containing protein [Deltaproteobacteria bacterium]MBW2414147.1 DUF922 domain-containing protein [Deltaproteobacteria bacterium]